MNDSLPVEPGQVVTARDWPKVEGKLFVVREFFVDNEWGLVAWATDHELGYLGVPMSRVIPVRLLTVDERATQERNDWWEARRGTARPLEEVTDADGDLG